MNSRIPYLFMLSFFILSNTVRGVHPGGPMVTVLPIDATCGNNGSFKANATGGTAPYQFSIDGVQFQDSGKFESLWPGTYTVTVKDANGETATTSAIIQEVIGGMEEAHTTRDTTICAGGSDTLALVSGASTYTWEPKAGLSDTNVENPIAKPTVTTTYTLIADGIYCSMAGSVTITVRPPAIADAGPPVSVCPGKSIQLHGSGGIRYRWAPSIYLNNDTIADPIVLEPVNSVVYVLKIVDSNGCSSPVPASVLLTVAPAKVAAGDDTTVLAGSLVPLHASDPGNFGFTQYLWSPAMGLNDPSSPDPTAKAAANTNYIVTAIAPDGCAASDTVVVTTYPYADILVPGGFTPNRDGHNDLLRVLPTGIRSLRYFRVYSRWGQELFSTANPATGWDGTVNGRPQPADTYVWTAEGIDFQGKPIERTGTVILIR